MSNVNNATNPDYDSPVINSILEASRRAQQSGQFSNNAEPERPKNNDGRKRKWLTLILVVALIATGGYVSLPTIRERLELKRERAEADHAIKANRYPFFVGKAPYHPSSELIKEWQQLPQKEALNKFTKWLAATDWLQANGLTIPIPKLLDEDEKQIARIIKYRADVFASEEEHNKQPLPQAIILPDGTRIETYAEWKKLQAQFHLPSDSLESALGIDEILRANKLAHEDAFSKLIGTKPSLEQFHAEWISLLGSHERAQPYLTGKVYRDIGYMGPAPDGHSYQADNLALIGKYFPELFLDRKEREALRLPHSLTMVDGTVVTTLADLDEWLPIERGLPTKYEQYWRQHPAEMRRYVEALLASGKYDALLGLIPKPWHLFLERAEYALRPGNESILRVWISDPNWYRVNRWNGKLPPLTSGTLSNLRAILACRRDAFLDAREREITPVGVQWDYSDGFFGILSRPGTLIKTVADWEPFFPDLLPNGPLMPVEENKTTNYRQIAIR